MAASKMARALVALSVVGAAEAFVQGVVPRAQHPVLIAHDVAFKSSMPQPQRFEEPAVEGWQSWASSLLGM
eukprot:CAMPEP_0177314544 /NCGR_PEP_ID=MMETSP0368-20130122/11985_1 /TAXON_ID=447022 ORGANISM="Scrippsiella hangoei-like, Strain SHHI-4" /NCGR_SAMPLE_ID=MMETSP0368 /ASSEMBLY_ACC=CAM_ASM_000363 /LENGTH=70 /DNA_ID=CAMNT_0018773689 /DNA_START=46 /DNA_END=255 /DNA_ORIENTATION=+